MSLSKADLAQLWSGQSGPAEHSDFQETLEVGVQGEVRVDKVFRAMHSTDASVYQIIPLAVVIPKSPEDVHHVVRVCGQFGIPITARGGGSSQAGQSIGAGVVMDFSKYMNRVLELNVNEQTVTVEPGIVLDNLNYTLKPYGLHFPVDLSSSNRATIGGMIGNNAAGSRSVVYGTTIDYVEELTAVLSDGSLVKTGFLDAATFDSLCSKKNLEGKCYRVVQKLAADHKKEIADRYPKTLRRVGGYNLNDFVVPRDNFNLSRILVGSEGTLGIVVSAKLRLMPLPSFRAVCVAHFKNLLEGLAAVPPILDHKPSAIELVDKFILDTTVGKVHYEPLRAFIKGDPEAILIIEFFGEDPKELPQRVNRLLNDLSTMGLGYHFHQAMTATEQASIWSLRKAALGLSMSETGDAKAIPFVEDTAVSTDRLRDYIEKFQRILLKHETRGGFYAHASVGLLHIRPVVNMKTEDGVEKFRQVAEEISNLVLEFGGAASGEHGDGLVRSPFQQKMFGSVLYDAFCELKKTFDPHNLLNPGKIVHATPITDNLKFGTKYVTHQLETTFDFSDFGGISRATEQCSGVGKCRKDLTGTMCPSFMATKDEMDSTRGRANALRMAISGQLGPYGLIDKDLYAVLALCVECKSCKTECPTGVDMARLKSEFLHQYQSEYGYSLRSRLLAHVDTVARVGSRFAKVANGMSRTTILRWILEKLLDLDSRRIPPAWANETFLEWWTRRNLRNTAVAQASAGMVAVFADTFINYYEPRHGKDAVKFAECLGFRVTVPPRVCCGRSLISKGLLNEAVQYAEQTVKVLSPIAEKGLPIVFCEPGCYSAVTDDHRHLLSGLKKEKWELMASACVTFEEWADKVLYAISDPGNLFRAGPPRIILHGHCHQEALIGLGPAQRVLSLIPTSKVISLDSGCCGMAGSFGYEREHYDVSRAIGERRLFPAVRDARSDDVIVAAGFSCRCQIQHFTGTKAISTMNLLHSLLQQP